MSVVIDGKDILVHNSYIAIVMGEGLESFVAGHKYHIPVRVLEHAKKLFSIGMDHIKEKRGEELTHNQWEQREVYKTYQLLTDILKKVKRIEDDQIDSELEKLANAINLLTPNGTKMPEREQCQTLQQLFMTMYQEAGNYGPAYHSHSPYSIGTFDNDEDD